MAEFDVLRTVALGMILACHFVESLGHYTVGTILGLSGNFVFFMMSGLLLGLSWVSRGRPAYGWRFLRHRLLRLAVPLWLFFVPWFLFMLWRGQPFSVKPLLLHLSLLNWFDHWFPGTFALWFVTAISGFYMMLLVVTRLRAVPWFLWALGLVAMQVCASVVGVHQSYLFLHLCVAVLAFLKGGDILAWMRRNAHMPAFAFLSVGCLFLGLFGGFCVGRLNVADPAVQSWMCYLPVALGVIGIVLLLSFGTSGGGGLGW